MNEVCDAADALLYQFKETLGGITASIQKRFSGIK